MSSFQFGGSWKTMAANPFIAIAEHKAKLAQRNHHMHFHGGHKPQGGGYQHQACVYQQGGGYQQGGDYQQQGGAGGFNNAVVFSRPTAADRMSVPMNEVIDLR